MRCERTWKICTIRNSVGFETGWNILKDKHDLHAPSYKAAYIDQRNDTMPFMCYWSRSEQFFAYVKNPVRVSPNVMECLWKQFLAVYESVCYRILNRCQIEGSGNVSWFFQIWSHQIDDFRFTGPLSRFLLLNTGNIRETHSN